MEKAIIVLSGGQDSTTCLYDALRDGHYINAITINYGQRHLRELQAADVIFQRAKLEHPEQVGTHEILDIRGNVLVGSSPLVSGNHLEQYENHQSLPGGIEKTFVPLRNMLFLTIAANRAVQQGARLVYTGVCQEDSGGYPDCRAVFIDAVQAAINLSNEGAAHPLEIVTPLMDLTKAESVVLALELSSVGFNAYGALAYSHTAYDGQYPPLGHDHATLLRAKGFEQACVPDPLILRAVAEGEMECTPDTENYQAQLVRDLCVYLDFHPK